MLLRTSAADPHARRARLLERLCSLTGDVGGMGGESEGVGGVMAGWFSRE